MSGYLLHDPSETLDYTQDWSDWMATGDQLAQSLWSVRPADGAVVSNATFDAGAHTSTVMLSNLTRSQVYQLSNTIVTTQGRTAERSFTIRCDER